MLIEVLTRLAADTGYHPTQQRAALLNLLQLSATEMHKKLDCNRIKREVTLVVQPDAVVSLPSYIGELKGMRMHTNELPFDLASMSSPRYVSTTLSYKFKNWRDLGESVVSILPTAGQLFFTYNAIENPPAQILISGKSAVAAKTEELLTLDSTTGTKATTNIFGPQLFKIACLTDRTSDIIIKDVNGVEIARLYTTDRQTRYKIVDVSQIFWTLDSSDGGSFIDILYKLPMTLLTRDSDSFYAGDDYDVAWYHMAMNKFYAPLPGRAQDAAIQLQMAFVAMSAVKDSAEGQIIKKMAFGRNKFFGIFRKYRYFPGSVTNVDHNVQS